MRGLSRTVAAHEVVIENRILRQAYVEITAGRVTDYGTFTGELPHTEWLGGRIEVRTDENGIWRAYQENKQIR